MFSNGGGRETESGKPRSGDNRGSPVLPSLVGFSGQSHLDPRADHRRTQQNEAGSREGARRQPQLQRRGRDFRSPVKTVSPPQTLLIGFDIMLNGWVER